MTIDYLKNEAGVFLCQHKNCTYKCERQNTMYYHMKRHMSDFTFTCNECNKGFIQKSAYLHHMAAVHPNLKDVPMGDDDDKKQLLVKNPYVGQNYKCPHTGCEHSTRTKANTIVHYARVHGKEWIPAYNKTTGCSHCKKIFGSVAAYLYHCTGCIPAPKHHREMIARITDNP